jgi:hypothetical protein
LTDDTLCVYVNSSRPTRSASSDWHPRAQVGRVRVGSLPSSLSRDSQALMMLAVVVLCSCERRHTRPHTHWLETSCARTPDARPRGLVCTTPARPGQTHEAHNTNRQAGGVSVLAAQNQCRPARFGQKINITPRLKVSTIIFMLLIQL